MVGALVPSILETLHQVPIINDLLAPLIGYSVVQEVTVDVGDLAPEGTPVAFTVDVISFDGVPISTNYFPASGQVAGDSPAPTVLNGPGLPVPGITKPYAEWDDLGPIPGVAPVRAEGYNVVTWDFRGTFASGGILQLDNAFFEGRDMNAIIDFLVANELTAVEGTTRSGAPDPLIGMLGNSYGGGIQITTAGIDQRIDAIVPILSWYSYPEALYPEEAFKTAWVNLITTTLVATDSRINSQIYEGVATGNLFGVFSESVLAMLRSSGPTVLVENITAPTLLVQGTVDTLFVLEQSVTNSEILKANGVPIKMIWHCGGHGVCLDPLNPNQTKIIMDDAMAWLNQHVKGETPPEAPNFQWFDQNGAHFSSDLLPFEKGFIGGEITASGDGGSLPLFPVFGGSGPQYVPPSFVSPLVAKVAGFFLAAEASNAVNLTVEAPTETTQVVGAPELAFTYSGVGTARFVYGQLVDDQTGRVLGNLVKPIPVTLDGQTREARISLENVVYTMEPGDSVTLQVTSSATQYEVVWGAFGAINITDIELTLPTVAAGVATTESTAPGGGG